MKNVGNSVKCNYCKKEGHTIRYCREPKCKASERFHAKFMPQSVRPQDPKYKPVSNVSTEVHNVFKDFIFDGFVSLGENKPKTKVKVLRHWCSFKLGE